jgi:hypothetical protein
MDDPLVELRGTLLNIGNYLGGGGAIAGMGSLGAQSCNSPHYTMGSTPQTQEQL